MMKRIKKIYKGLALVFKLLVKRPKGLKHFLLSTVSYLLRSPSAWGMPVNITIEPCSVCNLRCPGCETGKNILNREKGMLSLENFKKIIDRIKPFANSIYLYYMGEPFVNKDIYEMIAYAKKHRIFVTTCTNGSFIDAIRLVDSGLDEISFQIGGLTQETHEVYRRGSVLTEIEKNIRALSEEKKRRGASHPRILIGYILMKHNEHEIARKGEDMLALKARQWGADGFTVISPAFRSVKEALEELPSDKKYWLYDEETLKNGRLVSVSYKHNDCSWIWYSTVININGDIVPCCRDVYLGYKMGNIFEKPLEDIWNNEKYRSFRRKIMTSKKDITMCDVCSSFWIPEMK